METSSFQQVDANIKIRKRRQNRVDGLEHITPGKSPPDQQRMSSIFDIAFHMIQTHSLGLRILESSIESSNMVTVKSDFKKLLLSDGISHFDSTPPQADRYDDRWAKKILTNVTTLTAEQVMAFITDERHNQYYSLIVELQRRKWRFYADFPKYMNQGSYLNIPRKYEYCGNYKTYKMRVIDDMFYAHQRISSFVRALRGLQNSVRRAAASSFLTTEQLESLKKKMIALDIGYPSLHEAVWKVSGQHLIDVDSAVWWDVHIKDAHSDSIEDSKMISACLEGKATGSYADDSQAMRSTLNFVIPALLLISVIPAGLAIHYSLPMKGLSSDSEIYQNVTCSILQLLSLITFLWPTWNHPRLCRLSWLWIWVLAGFSATCAVMSMPLYLYAPTAWSFVVSFAGAVAQSIALLQVINAL